MKNQNKKYYKQQKLLREKNGDDPWNEIKLAHKFKKVKRLLNNIKKYEWWFL